MVGLEHVHRPGRAAIGDRVDEYQRIPVLEQVVGQMHAPDAVVGGAHPVGAVDPVEDVTQHLGTEAVVAEEDVADAGYQDAGRHTAAVEFITCAASSGSAGHLEGLPGPAPPPRTRSVLGCR